MVLHRIWVAVMEHILFLIRLSNTKFNDFENFISLDDADEGKES